MSKVLIDRAVVEQALEALEADNSKLWPREKRAAAIDALRAALEQPQVEQEPIRWPANASEVRAFLSGHVAAERYARDDHQPDDSDTYTLSAHDLLGAIYWWTDFDPQPPRQPLTDEAEHQCPYPKANPSTRNAWLDGWEAAERAHGITGEQE